jgi:hypothetical protein
VFLNNTIVPLWGYGVLFNTLGSFAFISLVMCVFFKTEKTIFIPYEEDRPAFA